MTTNAVNVARWFIQNNKDTTRNSKKGNMKLQKLLYFAQLVHLAKFDEPLFKEDVIAFRNGCVIEEVRQPHQYQHHEFISQALRTKVQLTEQQAQTVKIVNAIFGDLSADDLSDLNHTHKSWMDAYDATLTSYNYHEKSDGVISIEQMKENEVPDIVEMLGAYENEQRNEECLEINGRKFYFDPSSFTFDEEVLSMVESFNGPDSAYTIYRDPSVGVVIY